MLLNKALITFMKGNLFEILKKSDCESLVVAHGCNALGVMGTGFAKQIKNIYPKEMFDSYRKNCLEKSTVPGDIHFWKAPGLPILANMITQANFSNDRAKPEHISRAFERLFDTCNKLPNPLEVHMPAIGCGLGGMKKEKVLETIENTWSKYPVHKLNNIPKLFWWEL